MSGPLLGLIIAVSITVGFVAGFVVRARRHRDPVGDWDPATAMAEYAPLPSAPLPAVPPELDTQRFAAGPPTGLKPLPADATLPLPAATDLTLPLHSDPPSGHDDGGCPRDGCAGHLTRVGEHVAFIYLLCDTCNRVTTDTTTGAAR